MAKLNIQDSSKIDTRDIGQYTEEVQNMADRERKNFARHWYDNNLFDDGKHFQFVSRTTGRLVDLSEKASLYTPKRVVPKASRQIRGMANLLLSMDFIPVVKPEPVRAYNFGDVRNDQMAKQMFLQAKEASKLRARKIGHWIEEEWNDELEMATNLAFMTILTLKHGISYLQVWPDQVEEKINAKVYDAFDIYAAGNYTELEDSPFVGKVTPKTVSLIKANEMFDQEQLEKINPDNKYASDEIKEAYLVKKFGRGGRGTDASATVLQKEFFYKEYLNDKNRERIKKQKNSQEIIGDLKDGDPIIRHVFSAGNIWLYDKYEALDKYPIVDLRWEPGPLYQTAPIERFIPANKSLDSIMSRAERHVHTMDVGVWTKRKGENFDLTNVAGGLVAEYESVPPQQMRTTPVQSSTFRIIDLLQSFIEEQGVSTSTMGQLPGGVKAWRAIESLKASEMANFYIPIKMLKKTLRGVAERMICYADKYFVTPKSVDRMDQGEPDYFEVIGQQGIEARKKIKEEVPEDIIPIKKDYHVDIEIESGLAYTDEGKKNRAMEVANYMLSLAQAGLIPQETVKQVVQNLIETYKFGPLSEIMDTMDDFQGNPEVNENLKVAVLEVLKDAKEAGLFNQDPKEQIDMTKVGVAEVIKDTGLAQKPEPQQGGRETTQSEVVETGKDGKKTKVEYKVVEKS